MGNDNTNKKNCTTIFMVSPFGIGRERVIRNGFLGAYLGDVNQPEIEYTRGIFMLFKPKDMSDFQDFLYEEKQRKAPIIEDYDYDNGYVVLIYLLDDKFAADYEKFIRGKYSQFSEEFKETFPKTIRLGTPPYEKEEVTLQQRIFKKDKSVREYWENLLDVDMGDSEVWSKPNLEKGSDEWLDINKLLGNV